MKKINCLSSSNNQVYCPYRVLWAMKDSTVMSIRSDSIPKYMI